LRETGGAEEFTALPPMKLMSTEPRKRTAATRH